MAVTKPQNQQVADLSTLLLGASCALLAGLPQVSQAIDLSNWRFDAATLLYVESNNRVSALEPVISAKKELDSETSLSIKIAGDTLTGASPNGATPSDQAQTFTTPSGKGTYSAAANTAPLDDTFRDTRGALSVNWNAPLSRDWAYGLGGYLSAEHDYMSLGTNASVSRYLNNKNTTLSLGANLSLDTINPEGGAPVGLSRMSNGYAARKSSNDKNITDIIFGLTQIIDRRTLMQFNYSVSSSQGYLNDPYKILTVIDDSDPNSNQYGGHFLDGGNSVYLYEKRPDTRLKQSLYWQLKHQRLNNDIVDMSYRFMTDDWGINSHTIDMKYRLQLDKSYFEPQLRWYTQSKADFYQPYLTASSYQQVDYASADYRLGEMDTYTIGLRYGYQFDDKTEFYTRIAFYQQQSKGEKGIGKLSQQDLYPDLNATMLTVGYKF